MVDHTRDFDRSLLFLGSAGGTRLAVLFPGLGLTSSNLLVFRHSWKSRNWFGMVGWTLNGCSFFWIAGPLRAQQSGSRSSGETSSIAGSDFSSLAAVFPDLHPVSSGDIAVDLNRSRIRGGQFSLRSLDGSCGRRALVVPSLLFAPACSALGPVTVTRS